MAFEIDKKSMEDLRKKIEKVQKEFGDDKIEPILVKAAEIVSQNVKHKIKEGKTGNLKRAVITKILRSKESYPPTAICGIDRAIAPHAHLVEYGTTERFHKSGKSVGAAKQQPFFRPAWDESKGQVNAFIEMECKRLFKEATD
jgi:HK97 gp10 family phage protein